MKQCTLVTGGAKRVGREICLALAEMGYFVWIHYRSSEAEAWQLREEIRRNGADADCIKADLSHTEEIDGMFERIRKSGKVPELLVNNASCFLQASLSDTSPAQWDQVMNTNLRAVWYGSEQFVRCLKEDAGKSMGNIIHIGDVRARTLYAQHSVYGLSRYALRWLTRQQAAAYAPGVHVNLISPDLILKGEDEPDEDWQRRIAFSTNGKAGSPSDVLEGICWILKDRSLTGCEILAHDGIRVKSVNVDEESSGML